MKYHESVQSVECKSEILISGIEARYSLTITLNNKYEKMLTYIMMNPSIADLIQSDQTLNRVIAFAASEANKPKEIGKVNIVNLFGLYETKSPSLQSIIDQLTPIPGYVDYLNKNRNSIEVGISTSDYIVLAWGDVPPGMKAKFHAVEVNYVYDCIMNNNKGDSLYILNTLNQNHKTTLTKSKRPRHPNRINFDTYVPCTLSKKRNFLSIIHE
ncbi:DUF1643 domain-containing protein [Paenibacillus sp. FSL K6-2859]|uniref:DUF1643 domain-containing protein n=1 Tax=Paenibacillus sp. FSL K6-2859 TaxID=2921482 RepID=UPI0030FB2449